MASELYESLIPTGFLHPEAGRVVSENERQILNLVRLGRAESRADLTRMTDLTAQSVSRIVESLCDRGYLEMGERLSKGRGNLGSRVRLVPTSVYVIGFSIMTDAVSAALMDFEGKVLGQTRRPLERGTWTEISGHLELMFSQLITENGVSRERVFGLGVGVTGYFIGEKYRLNPPAPLEDLALIDIDQLVADQFSLPAFVDNDGNMAATGESLAGVGKRFDTFAYLYFSKGIGGSVVLGEKLFRGAFGNAGEFAGILSPEHHDQRPTLELLRNCIESKGIPLKDLNQLIDQFDPGWPGIDDWLILIKPHLQQILSAISSVLDPQAIVLGGRIPPSLAQRLIEEIQIYNVVRRGRARPLPQLVPSEVQGDATAIGAAATPLKAHFFSSSGR